MRFTGQLYDTDTGLYYLRARQYESGTGRFTQQDPLTSALARGYISSYSYVRQRPTVLGDPSGMVAELLSGEALGFDLAAAFAHIAAKAAKNGDLELSILARFARSGLATGSVRILGPAAIGLGVYANREEGRGWVETGFRSGFGAGAGVLTAIAGGTFCAATGGIGCIVAAVAATGIASQGAELLAGALYDGGYWLGGKLYDVGQTVGGAVYDAGAATADAGFSLGGWIYDVTH